MKRRCTACGVRFTANTPEAVDACPFCNGEAVADDHVPPPGRKRPAAAKSVCLGCGRRTTSAQIKTCPCGSDRIVRRRG